MCVCVQVDGFNFHSVVEGVVTVRDLLALDM